MADEITPEIFAHLVDLAALELEAEEAEYLRRELNKQLKAIHELEAIPINRQTKISTHGISYTPEIKPPFREDEWKTFPHPDDIHNLAALTEDGYIVVPDIPQEELE